MTVTGDAAAGLTLRVAAAGDAARVVALVESAYRGESSRRGWTTEADLLGGQRTDEDAVRQMIEAPASEVLLAERAGELVGCCHLAARAAGGAYFGMFAVSPALQGGGIGRWLITRAEERAREAFAAQILEMTVIAQREELIAWYRRLGYTPTGRHEPFPYGDTRFGLPRRGDLEFLVLEKRLGEG